METITCSAALGQAISLRRGTAMPTLCPVEAVNLCAHIVAPEFLGSLKENGQDTGVWSDCFLGCMKDQADKRRSVSLGIETWGILLAVGWRVWALNFSSSSAV